MPTYAENKKRRDIAAQRQAQDARDAVLHRQFDLQAQDQHHKHDRPSFSVVGEGSRAAQERYRVNYQRIFGLPSPRPLPPRSLARSGAAAAR